MRRYIFAAAGLLLLTNVVVLAGVAYNRSGTPVTSIELTERELPIKQSFNLTDENSGTALTLDWQILDPDLNLYYQYQTYTTPPWLNDEKLSALGFNIKKLESNKDKYQFRTSELVAETILVLEYDGVTYQKIVELAERKAEQLRSEATENPDDEELAKKLEKFEERLTRIKVAQSRLYVVDVGPEMKALVKKYSGDDKYLFAKGEIGLRWVEDEDEIEGYIRDLSLQQIHVPLPYSELLSELTVEPVRYYSSSTRDNPPRYTVQLNIGKRLEPWIESVVLMGNGD